MAPGRRTRHVVGEVICEGKESTFRYLEETPDFAAAKAEGFQGFPAFHLQAAPHRSGVLDAFLRRLPPRSRDDFDDYLQAYRLPSPFSGSDTALLGYTGARLPSDGFELVPDLSEATPPFELIIETAGLRHQDGVSLERLRVGDAISLVEERDNPVDPDAIAILHAAGRIGYVPRPYCSPVRAWLTQFDVDASIERINGKPDRPLVYLFVRVRKPAR